MNSFYTVTTHDRIDQDARALWITDPPYVSDFRRGWDSINGARAPWSSNPWVWVVEFQPVADEAVCA